MTSRFAPPASAAQFRQLLSGFASGVTVATAVDHAGRPYGMTASAVSAVSLEPPLLLVCVDHAADFHAILSRAERFALSVLAADQEHLSVRFAADRPDRFSGVPHTVQADGLPLVDGAAAHITCRKWGAYEAGDHTIFIGQVSDGQRLCGRRRL